MKYRYLRENHDWLHGTGQIYRKHYSHYPRCKKIMKENHLSKKNDEANEFGSKPWETVTVENHGNGCFW